MKVASLTDIKAKFGSYVRASKKSPVVITQNGKAIAAIISVASEDDLERILMAVNPRLRAIIAESKAQIKAGLGIPHDEFWRQMELRYRKRPQRKSA